MRIFAYILFADKIVSVISDLCKIYYSDEWNYDVVKMRCLDIVDSISILIFLSLYLFK